MNIKPKKRPIYECYYGGKDVLGTRIRRRSRVKLEFVGQIYYYFARESRRGHVIVIEKANFTKHFIPAAK
jgi:hypothetical protein